MMKNGTFYNKVTADLGVRMYKMVSQSGFPQLVVNAFILIAVLAGLFALKEPLSLLGLGMLQQVPIFQPMPSAADLDAFGQELDDLDGEDRDIHGSIGFTAQLKNNK